MIAVILFTGCNKYLEPKPDQTLVVPSTVQDLQAILDNTTRMNRYYPFATELAADNFYMNYTDWVARTTTQQNVYIWEKDVYNDNDQNDWSLTYVVVYYANVVLDNADKITNTGNVKGQALFFRSFAFYELLQVFAPPYTKNNGDSLGIPLRLTSDLNAPTVRNTIKECYNKIIEDGKAAINLLPVTQLYKTRPNKAAAYGLLARIYLSMRDYANAFLYADSSLQQNNTLMDFNALNASAANPIASFNTEDNFHSALNGATAIGQSVAKVDSTLYSSYQINDLRKTIFFKDNGNSTYAFKGTYDGSGDKYNGLASDEMYLIRAECNARNNNIIAAMNDLNTLLAKRFKTGTFNNYTATDTTDALNKILIERRKEVLMRGIRWTDLRRLNQEPQFAITIKRNLNGNIYLLPPNDKKYVFQIPVTVINITGIPQNFR